MEKHVCINCLDTVAGQAFTESKCIKCGDEIWNPSTHTANYCENCATEDNICKYCGKKL